MPNQCLDHKHGVLPVGIGLVFVRLFVPLLVHCVSLVLWFARGVPLVFLDVNLVSLWFVSGCPWLPFGCPLSSMTRQGWLVSERTSACGFPLKMRAQTHVIVHCTSEQGWAISCRFAILLFACSIIFPLITIWLAYGCFFTHFAPCRCSRHLLCRLQVLQLGR